MYQFIYSRSIPMTIIVLIVLLSLWLIASVWLRSQKQDRYWRIFCCAVLVIWVWIVFRVTLLGRTPSIQNVYLSPFHQLYQVMHGGNPEILRTAWMNFMLFIPGGLSLPELFPAKRRNRSKVILTVILAMMFSLGIELAQWHRQLGQAETDDVIANTLGAFLGCGIFVLGNRIISRKRGL